MLRRAPICASRKSAPLLVPRNQALAACAALLLGIGACRSLRGTGTAVSLLAGGVAFAQVWWPLCVLYPQQPGAGRRPEVALFGARDGSWQAELREAAAVGFLVLPLWCLLAWAGRAWWLPASAASVSPLGLAAWTTRFFQACGQALGLAFPEELFWRAYVQRALQAGAPQRSFSAGTWASCALFSVAHLAHTGAWQSLSTFFPSILFAWLFNRRGLLLAATLLHAACNVCANMLAAALI